MKLSHRTRLTPGPDFARAASYAVTWAALTLTSLALTPLAPARAQGANASSNTPSSGAASGATRGAPINLSLGKVLPLQPPANFRFRVDEGADVVTAVADNGILKITPQRVGRAAITVEAPGRAAQTYVIRVVEAAAPAPDAPAPDAVTSPTPAATITPAATTPAEGEASRVTPVAADASPSSPPPPAAPALPPLDSSAAPTPVAPAPSPGADAAQISPVLPAPAQGIPGVAQAAPPFPTNDARARNMAMRSGATNRRVPRNAIPLTQGLARLFRYSTNILAVFFSDVNVMDARAVNARTVAVTGLAPGVSTMAVFTERYPGDAVGQANVYQIAVNSGVSGAPLPGTLRDTAGAEAAIRAALNDPRLNVSVIQLPGGALTARLTGVVRDKAEIEAATSTARLFVPDVVSAIYADPAAPTLQSALLPAASTEAQIQAQLRRLTGNETIEVLPFNNGLALRAEVASNAEAEALFNLLPGLGRPVTPFVVVRGADTAATPSYYNRPVLSGESAEITRLLQGVTGITTVYASKVTSNPTLPNDFGIAIYGTVRNRSEYDTVRRYAVLLAQTAGASGGVAPPGTLEQALPANLASTGYRQPVGIHMFVRILDGSHAVVRRVIAETNVVEISRTAARALGIEVGTVELISESILRGTPPTTVAGPGGTTTTGGTPDIIQQELGTEFRQGAFNAGRGARGGFGILDPLRVRLNALYSNGNARILSQPNLSATDGATSQITVGGSRPIPVTNTGGGGSGTVQTSVEFRKFGIILTMRPTLTDDDTIILQVRADVTNIDPTFAINLNGAVIPGENVRSVEQTLTVREGDTVVMGGLITNERRQTTSRVPILSQIPIIGALFKSKRFENNETELAIFLTPRILRQPASPNTITDVERIPALPPLPSNEDLSSAFGAFGGTGPGGAAGGTGR